MHLLLILSLITSTFCHHINAMDDQSQSTLFSLFDHTFRNQII